MAKIQEMDLSAIRLQFELAVKQLTWQLANIHRPSSGARDICIVGSRRSGSTLLMQVIAANKGIKYCNQPLSVFSSSSHQLRMLPIFDSGQVIDPDAHELQQIEEYLTSIRSGSNHVNENWRFWQSDFQRKTDRIVFKVTDGHHLHKWFRSSQNMMTVSLIRHPIAQVSSVMRNGWLPRTKAFTRSPYFRETYLSPAGICKEIDLLSTKGTDFQNHVLGWCCENICLLGSKIAPRLDNIIYYEHFISDPEMYISVMCRKLDLNSPNEMLRVSKRRSISTGRSSTHTRKLISTGQASQIAGNWRRSFAYDEGDAFEILSLFGIDDYEMNNDFPVPASTFSE